MKGSPSSAVNAKNPKKNNKKRNPKNSGLSAAGRAFVHCSMNPFDISSGTQGVPDKFSGESIVLDGLVRDILTVAAGKQYGYLFLPAAPDCFFRIERIIAGTGVKTLIFTPLPIPAFRNAFLCSGEGSADRRFVHPVNVSAGRFFSAGIKTDYTGSAVGVPGVLSGWKFSPEDPLVADNQDATEFLNYQFTQFPEPESTFLSDKSAKFAIADGGLVGTACNLDGEWNMVRVFPSRRLFYQYNSTPGGVPTTANIPQRSADGDTDWGTPFYDPGVEAMIEWLPQAPDVLPAGGVIQYLTEMRACVELQPARNSLFASMSRPSPPLDSAALRVASDMGKKNSMWHTIEEFSQFLKSGASSVVGLATVAGLIYGKARAGFRGH